MNKDSPGIAQKISIPLVLPLLFLAAYFLFNRRCFFFDDEISTLNICAAPWSGFFTAVTNCDVHPPVTYFLFKIWFTLFGTNLFTAQTLSLLFMALGLFVYLLVWAKLFPKIKWLFLLVAIHPLLILWGGAARYYSPVFFLSNLSILYFLKIINKDYSIKNLSIYIFIAIVGLYTEFMLYLLLIPQAMMILGSLFISRGTGERRFLIKFIIGLLIIILAYTPWLPFLYAIVVGNLAYISKRPSVFANLAYIFYGGFLGQSIMPYELAIVIPAAIVFGLTFVGGARKMLVDNKKASLLWLGILVGILLFALPIRFPTVRHYLMIPGLVLIPVLYFIVSCPKRFAKVIIFISILAIYIYGDTNILLKRNLHKGGLADPIPAIASSFKQKLGQDKETIGIFYSCVLDYYLKEHKLKDKHCIFLNSAGPNSLGKLNAIFNYQKPPRVIYLWSYYGIQPDLAELDRQITGCLSKEYILASQESFTEDYRLDKIAKLIHPSYSNPRRYRYLIQEYVLRTNSKPK